MLLGPDHPNVRLTMGTTPRSIQSLLHAAAPDIADLIGRARFLSRMRAAILDMLPPAAAGQLQVAAYDQYRLTLHVSHGGWATRLRYMEPAIAQALAQRMQLHVEAITVRVRPPTEKPPSPAVARHISAANRAHIERVAGHVGNDELARALSRLARAARTDE